jgi:uncharacterized phiE125 gp8 family phage protein
MSLTLVTGPSLEPVTLDEIKDHLRISSTVSATEDTLLLSYIIAARDYCELYQNRAFLQQTWDYVIDTWPSGDFIRIPHPPLLSLSSVIYYGTGGTANTMTAGTYIVDTDSEPGRVTLGYGENWPTETLYPHNGVKVRFLAGYGSVASLVPMRIKEAIKLLVGHMYEHREDTDIKELVEMPYGIHNLLMLERVVPL